MSEAKEIPFKEKIWTAHEILPDGHPFNAIDVQGERVFTLHSDCAEVNKDCEWDIDRVLTDYTLRPGDPHEILVVILKRRSKET